jgi:hypothetical protein
MVVLDIPPEYGYVLGVAVAMFLVQQLAFVIPVLKARKATGIKAVSEAGIRTHPTTCLLAMTLKALNVTSSVSTLNVTSSVSTSLSCTADAVSA